MAISFLQPWFLLLLLPAAALLWRYSGKNRYPSGTLLPVRLCRGLFFLLLILALARPQLVQTFSGRSVIFLVDRSRSVETGPDYTGWINESLEHRRPEDQSAVLAFGRETQLLKPFSMEKLPGLDSSVDNEFTAVEEALKAAYSLIPADSQGRIVLISDGQENLGKALDFAGVLEGGGIPVDVLPVPVETGDEVAVQDLSVPRNSYPGQDLLVEIVLQSTVNTRGRLSLFWEGKPVYSSEVGIAAGTQRFPLAVKAAGEGFQKLQVQIEPEHDTLAQNNRFYALTNVQAPPRVLVVEGATGKGLPLYQLFRDHGLEVGYCLPAQLPDNPAALAQYRALFLVDLPAYALSEEQMQSLELFVQVLGGGVVAVGGKNSFGLGLYQETPLERLLPVSMEVEDKEELPGLDLVLVIDRSGSMSGEKLNMAKNAALVALDLLKERDRLAVISFDDRFQVELPLTEVKEKSGISQAIKGISEGGGTIIYPALEKAVQLLEEGEKTRHIILLSDGMEGQSYNYTALLEKAAEKGISVSTIALGADADRKFMASLAEQANGRYYYVPESADLPQVFLQETVMAGGDYLVEEEFRPRVNHPFAEALSGNEPLLGGYVASTLKPLAEALLLTHRDHPLLSRWQYGLGRAAAYTSDSWGLWSREFMAHPHWSSFWLDLLSWVTPQFSDEKIALDVQLADGGAEITAILAEPLEEGEKLTVSVVSEKMEQHQLELRPAGGGRYRGRLEPVREGVYMLTAVQAGEQGTRGRAFSGFAVPYAPEFQIPASSGEALLAELSSRTGGRELHSPREVFQAPVEPLKRSREIASWLLAAAIILWPLDIALRRFGLAPSLPARKKKRGPAARKKTTGTEEEAHLQRLLEAKKKGRRG
ncbi:MAG TPA: VWA domain-containing protein [Bacillota bacterium]|nr:VWA domain-containing protein [Bacillota bacterium]HOP68148.1 VWA domain-containing protein [Bacillota bacterium]HPT33018.1 VWA domain-containing protein [Bacillota bacterium]HQD06359.1 VWA domain-containing protein [Bacillota bacterium]